jgi:hypothetical protein
MRQRRRPRPRRLLIVRCASGRRRCGHARLSRAAASTAAPAATSISGGASPSRSLSEGPKSRFPNPSVRSLQRSTGAGTIYPHAEVSVRSFPPRCAGFPGRPRSGRVGSSARTSRAVIGRRCSTLLAQVFGGQDHLTSRAVSSKSDRNAVTPSGASMLWQGSPGAVKRGDDQ